MNARRRATVVRLAGGWWRSPASPERLAANRILTAFYTLRYVGKRRRSYARLHRSDPALFAPVGPVRVLRRPVPPGVADGLVTATVITSALTATGLVHRVTGPLHAALLTWTLAYRNSWSMVFHSDDVVLWHTWILGTTPAADAWSLDAASRQTAPADGDAYGWPLLLMDATTATTYWLAGVAKVAGPLGWRWTSGETLRRQVAVDGIRKEILEGSEPAPLAMALQRYGWVWRFMGVGTLVLELCAPLALVSPRTRRLWGAAVYGLHLGVLAVMDIRFRHQLSGVAFAPSFPLERVSELPAITTNVRAIRAGARPLLSRSRA